jgi:Domain of unknown function (DUF4112)
MRKPSGNQRAGMLYTIPSARDPASPEYLRRFRGLDHTAGLLDSRYRVPFTRVRFGWDAIVGLLPVVGDLATAAVSLHFVHRARALGADGRLASRMILNILIDALLGFIPIIGTVFDVFFRANERNLKLLIEHIQRHRRP